MCETGRAWIEVSRENLLHNAKTLQKMLPAGCELMPAVKADAYGHGAVWTARALSDIGIRHFCVACAQEGSELREAGVEGEILILGCTAPEKFDFLRKYRLTQTVVDSGYARLLGRYGKKLDVHVAVDSGMHRLGERSENKDAILSVWEQENLNITGVYSHLCTSDGDSSADRAYVRCQQMRFDETVRFLHARGAEGFRTHLQGSCGILNYPDMRYDLARPGIALYGAPSEPAEGWADYGFKPVLALKARLACVKELCAGEGAGYGLSYRAKENRRIAVAAIGYADGIPRALSEKGRALVCGQYAPVIGRVCMDQLLLDVTGISSVRAGDTAVFIGRDGTHEITAADMAAAAGTISNEILSRLGRRLSRLEH